MIALLVSGTASLCISYQDFKERAVFIFWFPIIFISGLVLNSVDGVQFLLFKTLKNVVFASIIFAFVILYFYLKYLNVNVIKQFIGAGDLLFIYSITPFFNIIVYVFFLCFSFLLASLVFFPFSIKNKNFPIPLAGFQALIFVLFLGLNQLTPNLKQLINSLIF